MGVQAVSTSDIGIVHSIAPARIEVIKYPSMDCVLDIDEDTYDMKETPYYYVNGEFVQGKVRRSCLFLCQRKRNK